jgi:hypothetical protein
MSRPGVLLTLLPVMLVLVWGGDRLVRAPRADEQTRSAEAGSPARRGFLGDKILSRGVTLRARAAALQERTEAARDDAERVALLKKAAKVLEKANAPPSERARLLRKARSAASDPDELLLLTARLVKLGEDEEGAARIRRMLFDPGIGKRALSREGVGSAAQMLEKRAPDTAAFLCEARENPEQFLTEATRRRRALAEGFACPEDPLRVTERFEKRFAFRVANPLESAFRERWKWVSDNPAWTADPRAVSLRVTPGEKARRAFALRYESSPEVAPRPAPALRRRVTVDGETVLQETHELSLDLAHFFGDEGRRAKCARIASPPRIDGRLTENAWRGAAPIRDFYLAPLDGRPEVSTRAWAAYDEQALYFAVRCAESEMNSLQLEERGRDGDVFQDDSIELFLDPREPDRQVHQFVVSADAEKLDVRHEGRDPLQTQHFEWNARWQAAIRRHEDAWTLEMRIPWRALPLDAPGSGDELGLHVARNRPRPGLSPEETLSHWSPAGKHSNFVHKRYGTLIFE